MAADPGRRFAATAISVTLTGLFLPAVLLGDSRTSAGALGWLLFATSSGHVAATAALFGDPLVRGEVGRRRSRYLGWPAAAVLAAVALVWSIPPGTLRVVLLPFFGWQLLHYQRQNLGVAALVGKATGAARVTVAERRCLEFAGAAATLLLVARPQTVGVGQLEALHGRAGGLVLAAAAISSGVLVVALGSCLQRMRCNGRTEFPVAVILGLGAAFPLLPLLGRSPYSGFAALTVAHGAQYLLLVGHVTARGSRRNLRAWLVFVATLLLLAAGIATASHLHSAPGAARLGYGLFLGVTMAHFLVDARLWRLRDPFARRWLGARLPAVFPDPPAIDVSLPDASPA